MKPSSSGEDLLGPLAFDAVDGASPHEPPVVLHRVGGGAAGVTAGRFDGGPLHFEAVPDEATGPFEDGAGDQPLDGDPAVIALIDGHRAGIFDPDGVDAVDDVGAVESLSLADLGTGDGAAGEDPGECQGNGRNEGAHGPDSIWRSIPVWGRWVAAVLAVLLAGAFAFAVFQPVQVLPRIRLAPGFALVDQHGDALTSDGLTGQVVLYGFAYGECGSRCDSVRQTMSEVAARVGSEVDLGDTELKLVTVSIDPERDLARLDSLAGGWGADGDTWRWATGEDPELLQTVLSSGFELYHQRLEDGSFSFDPRFVLVDGWGVVRGEYRYSTLTDDADKLVRHIGLLGDELRNSNGVATIAYEAAHIFMCYP